MAERRIVERVVVGYNWNPILGDCVVLSYQDSSEEFWIPFSQWSDVAITAEELIQEVNDSPGIDE